jgi:YidC/Oxa1 family membrane protein insertase
MEPEQKRLILIVVVVTLLALLWMPLAKAVGTWLGYDMTPQRDVTVAAADDDLPALDLATTRPGSDRLAGAENPQPVTLGSLDEGGDYVMAVDLVPQGAGVGRVVLNGYNRTVGSDDPYEFETGSAIGGDLTRPFTDLTLLVNGEAIDTSAAWSLVEADTASATYTATVTDEDQTPLAKLTKTYRLTTRDDASGGYEVSLVTGVENLTDQPLEIARTFAGPTTPPAELEDRPDRQILGGYFLNDEFEVDQQIVQSADDTFTLGSDLTEDGGQPLFTWAGASTIYFQAVVRPTPTPEQAANNLIPQPFASIKGRVLNPNVESARQREIALTFQTKTATLAPGESSELPLTVFFGPKLRSLMTGEYYDAPTVRFGESLIAPTGCTFCVFTPIVDALNGLLRIFHYVTNDWGLAIICLVLLVRTLLHPITKRAQANMMVMGKLGPQLKKLQEKYGDDKEGYARAAWQVQKKQVGIKPVLGCLPMILQTPIWIALYQSLQTTFELRHAPLLYGYTWIDDLSKPDKLIDFGAGFQLPCLFFPGPMISGLNILPLLLGVVFYFQMKLQPQPTAAMSPEQEQTQKIMKTVFPLIFPIFLYSAPSGLVLYILTSTAIGIVESKIVRDHLKKKDEEEKARGVVEIDDMDLPEPRKNLKVAGGTREAAPERKGVGGFWANLVEKAEQMKEEVEKQQAEKAKQAQKAQKGKKRK